MRRLVAVAVSIALLVSFSVLASAAKPDYSITDPELAVERTISYGWDVDGEFTPDSIEKDTGEEEDAILLVDVTRWVEEDVLDFDLDLDAVAEAGASRANLGDMSVVLQTTTEPDPEEEDWDDLVTLFDEDLPGSIEDDETAAIDQDFSLNLADLDEDDLEAFEEADGYRLYITVDIDEDGSTYTYTKDVEFSLPDEDDVVYNDAEVEVETNLTDELDDVGLDFDGLSSSDWTVDEDEIVDNWVVDDSELTLDEETGEYSAAGSIMVSGITGTDGSYDVDVDLDLYEDEAYVASATANLEVVFGVVDEEEEEEGDQQRDRDRDAWVDGLHPVHGMWMPPVHPGDDITLGNGALPLKFWLPEDYAEADEVSLVLFDDEDLGSGDVVHEWELTNDSGGMYKFILHPKKLDFELEPGTYYIAVAADGETLDGEDQVLTITLGDPVVHGNQGDHGNNGGHGQGKDK